MDSISTTTLSLVLLGLIILSAFFSSAETAMMSLNRYRLKHKAKSGHRAASLTKKLLSQPDRLIGLILIGNNFVNILAASIATIICVRLWGEAGIAIATFGLTIIVLVFAEVTPKTLAALNPEKVAFPAAFPLTFLLKVLYPAVRFINLLTNGLLRLLGFKSGSPDGDHLSSEELKTVVNEAGALIPKRHQKMLLSVLDLEKVTVEDIMVPKAEITGIDLDDDMDTIIEQLETAVHTRMPVYRDEIDHVVGFLHARQIIRLMGESEDEITHQQIEAAATPVYFIPEGTPLNTQLLNFQRKKTRIGLVVDEYGDIQGLVTLEDILEEIVGEFTTDFAATSRDIQPQEDGSYVIDASATLRDLNKSLNWTLPTDGPKTLNGLIIEYMESIPLAGTGLRLHGYPMEILHTKGNMIRSVRVWPDLYQSPN